MKRFTDLSYEKLEEIYDVAKANRPVLVQELKEDKFEDPEDKAAVISGITFLIGSEVLQADNPLNSEAFNISNDIYHFMILGRELGQ